MNASLRRKVSSSSVSVRQWLKSATEALQQAGIPSARLDSELLLADALKVDRTWLAAHADDMIDASTAKETLLRRSEREPLAYIRGWQEFYGRRFSVNPSTLIPRPESETMIDILKELPIETTQRTTIYDIGTGSGCLGITAALEVKNADVTLVDISDEALSAAQKNAHAHKVSIQQNDSTVAFEISDLLSSITTTPSVILANLPYVDAGWKTSPETQYEPSLALFAEQGGPLIYSLIRQARARLAPNGYLLLEADIRQMQAIEQFAIQHSFTTVAAQDYIIALKKQA